MRNTILLYTAAITLAAAGPLNAQTSTTPDPLTPGLVLTEWAEQRHRENRLQDALRLYRDAVGAMDAEQELPVKALQRIATIHLAAGRTAAAASAMDQLAERAEWLGFPDVQARALMEAAALHQAAGARMEARERARRLEALLGSPHIAENTLREIRARLRFTTAAR